MGSFGKSLQPVTDTCIPEEEAFRRLQKHVEKIWKDAETANEQYFPHEFMYKMLLSGDLEQYYEIDPKNSWMLAAAEKNIPIVCPGWEDSTMGNIFASYVIKNELKATTVKSGIEYMVWLADWYRKQQWRKRCWLLPDRRRYSRRFPDLCCANDVPGS